MDSRVERGLRITLILLCATPVAWAAEQADLLFTGGLVYTVSAGTPRAEAVAVIDDRIVWVGKAAEQDDWVGPETRVVDLRGGMLLPGFQDSHLHLHWGGLEVARCSLESAADRAAVTTSLMDCEARLENDNDWLVASQWNRSMFPGGTPPAGFLDELFPRRPVSVVTSDGHTKWVNQPALDLAGIDETTVAPANGFIDRDPESGKPTGLLGAAAMSLIDRVQPPPSDDYQRQAIRSAIELANSFGITSSIEPGVTGKQARLFRQLAESGDQSMRILLALAPLGAEVLAFGDEVYPLLQEHADFESMSLKANSVKVFADGAVESNTAALLEPYLGQYDNGMQPFYSADEMARYFARFDQMGINIHVHAIGDLAIRRTLDAFETMRAANGPSDNRHVITHLQLIALSDRPRFAALGIAASFSPLWAFPGDYTLNLYPGMIGPERTNDNYPIKDLAESGARIAGSSDWSVDDMNPLLAMEAAITRKNPWINEGPALTADQAVDLPTVIEAYTRSTAWLMSLESETGSIEVGKKADLVALDTNLFEIPAEDISEARVTMTVFDGKVVYEVR